MIFKLSKNRLFFKNYFKKIAIFGLVLGIFLSGTQIAYAAQFGRPASTVSTGSWTVVGAATLHEATDEVTANGDTDYANATVNTTAELKLGSVADPGVSSGHTVRWSFNPAGSGGAEQIVFDLYQGGTLIRSSGNITGTRGTYNAGSLTLTGPEADLISNYSDLRIRITTPNLGASDSMRVTWLEFEVPDAPVNVPPSLSVSQPDGIGDTVIVGDLYNITYTLSDPEETVTAAFYYDTDATGLDGSAISGPCASALEGSGVTCVWDTTGINPGSYYVYGITSDGVNPQVSAYSSGQITINIEPFQEILNKLDALETKVDILQTQTDLLPQSVWEYANRSLTSFGTLVADIWTYPGRGLDNISNITQGVWEYSTRSLTSFGTLAADIWSYSGRSLDNISNITQGVWEYPTRTLTSGVSIAQDIWNAATRQLTSRQIGVSEYIAGVTDSGVVSQVADQPTQATVAYNVDLVRKATFDFAGIADVGGSTLTLVDTELDQPNAYWNNYDLVIMSGANIGQKRAISSFDKNTNTITVSSAFSFPITSDDKYVISHEGKLVNAIWSYADRTLTGFGTLAADIWSYPNRTLTSVGSLAADIWDNTFAPTRRLTDNTLTGGGTIATTADLTSAKDAIITEVTSNRTLIAALNNISAADVWNYGTRGLTESVGLTSTSTKDIWDVAKSQLTTAGSIGKQIADNLDAAVSSRSTLTAADVWDESTRTLTDYATSSISLAVWSEATRELTNYGNNITAADVWNTLSNTLTLQDSIGKQLATNVDVANSTRASQASIDALNNISATDVWSYANRGLTEQVALTSTSTDAIWEYALTQIGDTGSIGKLLKDNIDTAVSSRGTSNLTAADVWNSVTRTLTSNANFNDPDSATIAAAVWANATRELTNYGNNITAQDVWNILSSNLTTSGTIGNQLAANVDAAVSTRSTLTAAAVWGYTDRTLTDFGTLVADIWSYSTRSLTTFGTLAADIWDNTFAPTRRLTDQTLTGGGQIATQADVTAAKNEIIALINGLNNISAANVWDYSNRSLTDSGNIWDYALTQIGTSGSIGQLLKDNIDATISSRGTSNLTAADVWNAAVRTLTANTNLGISTPAEIASAIWDEAIASHATAGSTGAALSTAGTGGGGGVGGLTIETHTVSEFEQGDTAAAATIQVLNNGVPVTSGVTPTGVYYDPSNNVKTWPGEGSSTVNFTEIGTTGIYTHNFDTTGADLGVYKLAVSAAQSSGGSNYSDNFNDGNDTGWANTGNTYVVTDEGAPQNFVYRKSDYGGFMYAFSTAGGNFADFTYTAKVRMDTLTPGGANASSDYVGITFRYANSSQNYDFYFRRGNGNVRLRKNGATLQESVGGAAYNKGQWYTMKVVVTGGHIQGYVDDVLKVDYTDSSPLPEGMIGLMTYNSVGSWDDISVATAGTSQYAYIAKDFAIVSPKSTLTAAGVWNVATSSLTNSGSIGKALADNRVVKLTSDGAVLAGSGTFNYKTKLYIYDLASQLVNAVGTPSITLYDSTGGVATGPTAMTADSTGIYSYQYTVGSSANTGRWEAVVTIDTGGTLPIKTSDYFAVESSPARVTINSITDNTVPSITANFVIANEGNVGNEYQYEYCVVDTIGNVCGGGDDIAYGLSAEFIEAGIEEQFNKTLTVNNTGTYFWKVAVYWGTERSVAVLQFNAVSAPEPEPTPTPGPGGGGGGGGGPAPTPTPPPVTACMGADFSKDGIVNSTDFSILLYFWKTQPPFRNACVDINKDAQVNSVDFSILLYQWGKPGININ
ncbi:MAG: DUF1080 domain-containing protein [bacterium]|nr:DUF1080 domain-containing protein [bacterium]